MSKLKHPPTKPRFRIGQAVIAPNGQWRIVLGMRWTKSMKTEATPDVVWGWALETCDVFDPSWRGAGFEWTYREATR